MKIPRRQPEPKPAEQTIWEKLADYVNNPGNWEHLFDDVELDHSHGSHSPSVPEQRTSVATFNHASLHPSGDDDIDRLMRRSVELTRDLKIHNVTMVVFKGRRYVHYCDHQTEFVTHCVGTHFPGVVLASMKLIRS